MAVPLINASFTAGELSPGLWGRVDLGKFHIGLATERNMYVDYRGGAYSRAGTKFVGFSAQTGRTIPPRLITFQFNINQGLALEFGNHYMRVVSNGAFVTNSPTTITGITNASPGVVHDVAHGYTSGTWVYLANIGGMVELNGQTFIVVAIDADHYSLTDVYGTAIDTTTFHAYTSGGTASSIYTLTTPYAEADLEFLKWVQSADVMSICCWNQTTGTLYPPYELVRFADNNWTITQFSTTPTILPPATMSGTATVVASGTNLPTDYKYVATAVSKTDGSESVASPIADVPNSVDIALTAGSINLRWAGVANASYYNIYKAPAAYNSTVPTGAFFGFAGSTYGTSFVDSNIVTDFTQTPPTHTDPFAGGSIVGVTITNGSSGLSGVTWAVTTSTGSGFDGYPVITGGVLTGFVVTNQGLDYAGSDTITFSIAGTASGALTFSGNPSNGDTITLNSIVFTFVNTVITTNQILIGGSLATTLVNALSVITGSPDSHITVASYTQNGTVIGITYRTPGTVGNSYTLAASVATPSAATLTGGGGVSGAAATGSYTFTGNPTNGQTIVLNGQTWTFVTGAPAANQTTIQGSAALTVAQLVTNLNASSNVLINVATYGAPTLVLNITYDTVGTAGNAYTIGAGSYGGTPSGPTLTGGVNAPSAPTGTLVLTPGTGNYPSVVTYFQQRRIYASGPNAPDTYYMSQPGRFNNFDSRIPTIDSDAIIGSPWSLQVDGIQFMVPMPGGLVALTGSSAWQVTGAGGSSLNPQPITPAGQQAQPQAYNGCSNHIPPIKINFDVLYNQAKGSIWRDLSYNFFTNIYTGADLTYLSSQLFTGFTMRDAAWCEEPLKIVWVTRDDGTLLSLTYLKEQEVTGWARHDTQGQWWTVCSVTEPPVDALYLVSQRYKVA